MAKIQTYVNNDVFERINDLVNQRKMEGITDVTISNFSSMLLELGLRVYTIQREKKEGGFNQMEYNRMILENTTIVRAMTSQIMKMATLNQEVIDTGWFNLNSVENAIECFTKKQVGVFFTDDSDDDVSPLKHVR